jgi:HSP20 family protein
LTSKQDLVKKFLELQDRIHSLIDGSLVGSQDPHIAGLQSHWAPAVDVYETEEEFVMTAEVPGIDQNQVDLQVVDDVLHLKGRRDPTKEPSKQIYYRLERPLGSFERCFTLPEGVDQSKIRAKMRDGVLTVTLPKKREGRHSFRVEVRKVQTSE